MTLSTPVRILLGFSPWMAFGALQPVGPTLSALGALALSLTLCVIDRWRGSLKAPELVAAGFFAALPLCEPLGWSWPRENPGLAVHLALAGMAFGGIALGVPFTLQYAREAWPRELWDRPQFIAVNTAVTAIWGVIFLIGEGIFLLAPGVAPLVSAGVTTIGVLLSRPVSLRLVDRGLARDLKTRQPYDWPAPALIGPRDGGPEPDAVVVGAGIGGLTAAALLAKAGARVTVVEAHDRPGGFCSSWDCRVRLPDGSRGRFVFDAGVHDVSGTRADGPIGHLLRTVGVADRVNWQPVNRGVMLNGRFRTLPDDADGIAAMIAAEFPDSATGVAAFMAEMRGIYRDLFLDCGATGLPNIPRSVEAMRDYPVTCPHAFRWRETGFLAMLDRFVPDAGARRLLAALTVYISDKPETLRATDMAPIFGYYFDGGFYPEGGSQRLADALVDSIRANGGEVLLRTPVSRILVEDGRAAGVLTAEGQRIGAAAVVANSDLRKTVLELVGAEHLPADYAARVTALRPASSAFMVTLALDILPDLPALTFMMDTPRVVLALPSAHDRTLAPAGCASLTLLTLAPPGNGWDRAAPDYRDRKTAQGDALIAAATRVIPELERHILHRQDATAATFARYARTTDGAIYGFVGEAAGFPAKTPIPGLVLASGGAFPGPGVEAVVISGRLAAEAVVGRAVIEGIASPTRQPGGTARAA